MTWRPWRDAWEEALYGPDGFYRRPEGPSGHFRTAAHASSSGLLGRAVAELARRCACTTVVDVGAGRGELLSGVAAADPDLRLVAVERAARPQHVPSQIRWRSDLPAQMESTLLVGWELLDVVPCTVLEVDSAGVLREVLVADDGSERLGDRADEGDVEWSEQWWPIDHTDAGLRVEVGRSRDLTWSNALQRLASGLAIAVDYGHDREDRPPAGTLTGFRAGRQVLPVPDGSTDITAHVALDSLTDHLRSTWPERLTARLNQRQVLRALGVSGRRPPLSWATSRPNDYLRALQEAGEAAELLASSGLGGFGWVLHAAGPPAEAGLREIVRELSAPDSTPG